MPRPRASARGAVDQHGQRIDRLGVDQDRHLHQVAVPVVLDLVVEAGIALRDRLQPVVEVEHHLVQRQVVDHHGAGADVGELALDAAAVLAELDHGAEILVRRQDGGLDPGLVDAVDLHQVGHVGRVVQLHHRAVVHVDLVDHRWARSRSGRG